MEFFRPHLKERHGARTLLAAALGVCYGSARKAKLRMSLTAQTGPAWTAQRTAAKSPKRRMLRCVLRSAMSLIFALMNCDG
jgi:hypothetical protein